MHLKSVVFACAFGLCAAVAQAEDRPADQDMSPAPPAPQSTPAATPLDAEGFAARTTGQTITYSAGGRPYGVEQYLPGRRVLWAFAEGACKEGKWFARDEQICFDYRDENGLQCWKFYDTPAGLKAQFMDGSGGPPLISLQESAEPLLCPGPEVGV